MALVGVLSAVLFFAFVSASIGHRFLRIVSSEMNSDEAHFLCSAAIGAISLEVLIFLAEITNHVRLGLLATFLIASLFAVSDFSSVLKRLSAIWVRIWRASKIEKLLAGVTAVVVLLEFLAAMAPLTASDALHYHFAVPLQIIRQGFHPNLFLSHSFFCGQSHLLILLGLALRSERLAMGLLFLGGIFSAAAASCLARRWMSRRWAWIVTLLFLLTPIVFWQVSSAGAPDLWMSFFATMGVIVISQAREVNSLGHAVLVGVLTGGIAGAKYTGCIVAAALALAFFVEVRSVLKTTVLTVAALLVGAWPYARNLMWTGDPVFPFLLPRLFPSRVNAYALTTYLADTGVGVSRSFWQLLKFPVFAWIDPARVGFWQFFGPLVLAFVPLLILVVRNTPAWRTSLTVWIVTAIGIGCTSSMTRFLLPIFPIALAAVTAGVIALDSTRWKITRMVSVGSIALYLAICGTGLLIYINKAVAVTLGLVPQESYLRANAPDYEAAEFVNQVLQNQSNDRKVLVFMRHVYFLRVPFLYGNPKSSWGVDPSKLRTPEEWQTFFQANEIAWIARSPDYPPALAPVLDSLEKSGDLIQVAQTEVENFKGKRIFGVRERDAVVILRVKERSSQGAVSDRVN